MSLNNTKPHSIFIWIRAISIYARNCDLQKNFYNKWKAILPCFEHPAIEIKIDFCRFINSLYFGVSPCSKSVYDKLLNISIKTVWNGNACHMVYGRLDSKHFSLGCRLKKFKCFVAVNYGSKLYRVWKPIYHWPINLLTSKIFLPGKNYSHVKLVMLCKLSSKTRVQSTPKWHRTDQRILAWYNGWTKSQNDTLSKKNFYSCFL